MLRFSPLRQALGFVSSASLLLSPCLLHSAMAQPVVTNTAFNDVSQKPKVVDKSDTLDKVLNNYAHRKGVVIVAEVSLFSSENVWSGKKITNVRPETTDELADLVKPFDYDVKEKSGVLILRRRYDLPCDVPDVTPEECEQFLDDALSLIAPFVVEQPPSIQSGTNPLVTNLHILLSPQQKEQNAQSHVKVRDLPASQQAALRQSSLFIYTAETAAILETDTGKISHNA